MERELARGLRRDNSGHPARLRRRPARRRVEQPTRTAPYTAGSGAGETSWSYDCQWVSLRVYEPPVKRIRPSAALPGSFCTRKKSTVSTQLLTVSKTPESTTRLVTLRKEAAELAKSRMVLPVMCSVPAVRVKPLSAMVPLAMVSVPPKLIVLLNVRVPLPDLTSSPAPVMEPPKREEPLLAPTGENARSSRGRRRRCRRGCRSPRRNCSARTGRRS